MQKEIIKLMIENFWQSWKHSANGNTTCWSSRPGDGIYRPPEPKILPHNKSLEPQRAPMGSVASLLSFHIGYCPGSRGGESDALSRRPEYRLEERAPHCKQTILKPEYFEVSLCHRKDRIQVSLVERKKRTTNWLRIK